MRRAQLPCRRAGATSTPTTGAGRPAAPGSERHPLRGSEHPLEGVLARRVCGPRSPGRTTWARLRPRLRQRHRRPVALLAGGAVVTSAAFSTPPGPSRRTRPRPPGRPRAYGRPCSAAQRRAWLPHRWRVADRRSRPRPTTPTMLRVVERLFASASSNPGRPSQDHPVHLPRRFHHRVLARHRRHRTPHLRSPGLLVHELSGRLRLRCCRRW